MDPTTHRPGLARALDRLERTDRLDVLDPLMRSVSDALVDGPCGDFLRGRWLGHALHPLASDLPLGFWSASAMLDLFGSRRSRRASQRLVGLGLLAAPVTAAAGVAEWRSLDTPAQSRVATVHGVANLVVTGCYLVSWRRRRAGKHAAGAVWGLLGGVLAIGTGYLGGHLSFARGTGIGERWPTDAS